MIFNRMSKETFNKLPSNAKRLEYLQDWQKFVVNKAKSCTTALGNCTGGVSKVEKEGDNTVLVKYGKKDADKCAVTPTDTDTNNYGIRTIVSDKPTTGANDKDAGRTYTIKYGENNELQLTLSRGSTGTDGAMGDGWGTFDRYRRKLINPGVTGFSASGKVVNASVTGFDVGAKAISVSLSIASLAYGIAYFSRTGLNCDHKASQNVCHVNDVDLLLNHMALVLEYLDTKLASQNKNTVIIVKTPLQNEVDGLSLSLAGIGNRLVNAAANVIV